MRVQYAVSDVKVLVTASFLMKVFHSNDFLNNAFHVSVRQRVRKSVLYQILDIYPHISFMNKGLSVVQKLHMKYDYVKVF